MPEEEDASRRSKSLDGDATIGSALIVRHFTSKVSTLTLNTGYVCGQKLRINCNSVSEIIF
jgi:hypothetical protein